MYDICVISFSSLLHDARSLNIIRTLAEKYSIAAVSLTNPSDKPSESLNSSECFKHFYIDLDKNARHLKRWMEFNRKVRSLSDDLKSKVIIAGDLYSLLPAVSLKKQSKAKLFYDSREIYSALGPLSKSAGKQIVLSQIEKYLVRSVDGIIVSGALDAEYLKSYFKTKIPFHVILNVPPYRSIVKSNIIKEKYPYFANKTVLLYQGAVLPGRGLEQALSVLQADESLGLAILGEGFYLSEIKQKALQMGLLSRIAFCGNIPYSELHDWTCSADIGLNLIEPISLSYRLALPNKMFEYIMAGLPQLASDLPAMRAVIDEYRIGVSIPVNFNVPEIINSINHINENRQLYVSNCLTASKIFCYSAQSEKIKNIF